MSRNYTTTVPLWILDGSDGELLVTFDFVPGCPETPPAYDHGGLPAEGPEFDVTEAWYLNDAGRKLAPCLLAEHEAERVREYLSDEWEPPSGPDPDDERDRRRDEEMTR